MKNYTVFITSNIPQEGINLLQRQGYILKFGSLKKAKGAHALLCLLTDTIDAKVMDFVGPQLKIISNMAAGLDNIEVHEAVKRGITFANTPGVLTEAVAEHTVALLLAVSRRVVEGDRFVRAKKYKGWQVDLLLGQELQGKVLGIVGYGRIGSRVAAILEKGFGMRVVYHDEHRNEIAEKNNAKYVSFRDLLRISDAVSLHVPLLAGTLHLVGEKELRMMKKTAYFINTSRGAVVDEKALAKALEENTIAGAGIDVFEHEPKIEPSLLKLQNAVLTPHIASASHEARVAMAELAAKNIIRVLGA
ncbi:MAG: D-glycerate dehydrogenase [Candidatus Wildermuthbacteria bacterium]|nr:D-glycerate dehydrogenase [Candidatus Wildermuthbacteria bacterium]